MGEATIIADLGEGRYTIQPKLGDLNARLAFLASRRAALESELPILRNTVAMKWDEVYSDRETVNALVEGYIEELTPDPNAPSAADLAEVLRLVNEIRSENGLPPLSNNSQLADAAKGFAEDRAAANDGGHTGMDGSAPKDRISAAGYDYANCGENVASGQRSPREVVEAWMNSPPHRANILNPDYTEIGLGGGGNSESGSFWVQNFGRPR